MRTFPLNSLTLTEAQHKQFSLVEAICEHFPDGSFLAGGDVGLVPGLNQPRTTRRVEATLATFFQAEDAVLVQGAGTGAIRVGLQALIHPGGTLLVHDAPVYPTTINIIAQMGLSVVRADFNDIQALTAAVAECRPDAALIQHSRQQPEDSYLLDEVLDTLCEAGMTTITDDNYAVMKVPRIGCECGATLSAFSCFKLFGPEGIGAIVGKADAVSRIRSTLYSGGNQVQGMQALDVLRGMVFAPVMHAVQAGVTDRLLLMLNLGAVPHVKQAMIASAQSRVLLIEFDRPIAQKVLKYAPQFGALPYPVGAESKYEVPPLFYRLSSTFCENSPVRNKYFIRINPNRSGEDLILRILEESCRLAMSD